MNYNEARFKANANHDDGTVPWHNDPSGRPFKSNLDKPLREILAFGCDRHVQGGAVCPHWCGQDKCGVTLAEPAPGGAAPTDAPLPPLPVPDGYVAMTHEGSFLVPPQEIRAHNCYAIFTSEQMREYGRAARGVPGTETTEGKS